MPEEVAAAQSTTQQPVVRQWHNPEWETGMFILIQAVSDNRKSLKLGKERGGGQEIIWMGRNKNSEY